MNQINFIDFLKNSSHPIQFIYPGLWKRQELVYDDSVCSGIFNLSRDLCFGINKTRTHKLKTILFENWDNIIWIKINRYRNLFHDMDSKSWNMFLSVEINTLQAPQNNDFEIQSHVCYLFSNVLSQAHYFFHIEMTTLYVPMWHMVTSCQS